MKGIRAGVSGILALVLLTITVPGFSKHKARPPSTSTLLKALCKSDEQAADAVSALKARKHVIAKAERFVARAKCSINKDAVLSLYDGLGPKGCQAIAGLLNPKKKAWLDTIILRYRALHTCPKLKQAIYKALDFAGPEQALRILGFAIQDRDTIVDNHAFQWLDKGPQKIRLAAVTTLVNSKSQAGYTQIMKAYNRLMLAKSSDIKLRTALLRGMLKINVQNTIPLLINALSNPIDKASACDLLAKVPAQAAKQMTMAMRMIRCTSGSHCPFGPIIACISKLGTPAIAQVLSLFDLHRPFIRKFVVSFLRQWKSRDVLEFLAGRYPESNSGDRAAIVKILGGYSLKNKRVSEIIGSAFKDGNKGVRLAALDMVTANEGVTFCPQIQDLAENDLKDRVKAAAVDTIYRLGCRKAIPLLRRMVTYETPLVSIRGLHALALMLETGNLAFLYKLLDAGNENVANAVRNTLFLLTNADPTKHHVSSLPRVHAWKFKGRKLKLPDATAWVSGNEKNLVIVVGGGLDGTAAWVLPGMKDLVDEYTAALVIPDSPLCPTEAVIALLDKVKHKRAYVMGNGIWALDAARLQLALPYQLQGAILVNPPYPTPRAIEEVSKSVVSTLAKPFQQAIGQLMKESALILPKALNRYYAKLVSPALAPVKKASWSVWGMPSDTLRYNQAQTLLKKAMDRNALSQAKALIVFSGRFIPEKQQAAFRRLKGLRIKKLKDCGYFVSQFCMDDLVDEIRDFTGD